MPSLAFSFSPEVRSSIQTSIKTSIDVLKARDTLASTVTTLPKGTERVKATWLTEAVTTICLQWRLAEILAARSMRANSSPPNKLFKAFVSPGKTTSVRMVLDCSGVFACIVLVFNYYVKIKFSEFKRHKFQCILSRNNIK